MTAMIEYSLAMLDGLAAFFAVEPIFYLFCGVLFCFVCKGISLLFHR